MNLLMLRLSNGELLVGDVVEDGDNFEINKPFQFGAVSHNSAGLIDFFGHLSADTKLTINKEDVIYSFTPNTQIEELYIMQSTGIELSGAASTGPELDISDLTN